ncbi:hypothetical protein F4808DRAFT_464910 [Astrocystis sublimbata]|nr:hypothetical protein F4808DRAFT_464910 [Astrocystis sublimbata]
MPPLTTTPLVYSLISRDTLINTTTHLPELEVVCAYPVSGQYGFGTRILYYVLVATCVLARRKEWLRNACLAAALLLPAVAAIHAVVLAAVHRDTAVDMDIYGAFQICSIGILAAPITVYNSKTYFNDPGRNIIFIWTGLLLAGMLSLTIEFFRIETHGCGYDDMGAPIDPFNAAAFPYNRAMCGLPCVFGPDGPNSPIRQDPTNEPAVIPVPHRLTFNAVTLLAAASSIPPVLTLIFTWEKILEINWKRRFAREDTDNNVPIDGTNGATPKMITVINSAIRNFLQSIQIPIFAAIVVVLIVIGELNFWSPEVSYQTEPFTSVGQWANVTATVLVVLGSLVYVRNEHKANDEDDRSSSDSHSCKCSGHHHIEHTNGDHASINSSPRGCSLRMSSDHVMESSATHHEFVEPEQREEANRGSFDLHPVTVGTGHEPTLSISNRHRNTVATVLNRWGEYLGTPAPDRYDNSVFAEGKTEFPEIPGEAGRVAGFKNIQDRYRASRQLEEGGSVIPGLSRTESISSFRLNARDASPAPSMRSPLRSNTMPAEQRDLPTVELGRVTTSPAGPSRPRRDTLEVPSRPRPAHLRFTNGAGSSLHSPTMILDSDGSPKIIVSAEPEDT